MPDTSSITSPILLLCLLTWRCCDGANAVSYDAGAVVGPAERGCPNEYVTVAGTNRRFPYGGCYKKTTRFDHAGGLSYANYGGTVPEARVRNPMVAWNLRVSFLRSFFGADLYNVPSPVSSRIRSALFACVMFPFRPSLFRRKCFFPCGGGYVLGVMAGVVGMQWQRLVARDIIALTSPKGTLLRRWCHPYTPVHLYEKHFSSTAAGDWSFSQSCHQGCAYSRRWCLHAVCSGVACWMKGEKKRFKTRQVAPLAR